MPSSNHASVAVTVPARLHLGFIDLGNGPRRFGSIGLAIDGLRTSLRIERAAQARIDGPDAKRVRAHVVVMERRLGIGHGHRVTIDEVVPAHAGLGSGTQLALAVAAGLRRLHNSPLDLQGDAVKLGRGMRSGVGIGLFDQGGLVVDGGHGPASRIAPIVSRLPFPEPWRIVLVMDPARQGAHGIAETAAFARSPTFPTARAEHICRLVLMQALPAVVECDLPPFGAAISEIQALLGDYFAPSQGGSRFTSPQVGAVIEHLGSAGACGIGQSSWGPTGFAFAASSEEAGRLAAIARAHPAAQGLDIRICPGLNRGAVITTHAAAAAPK
jgi:beta-ribofuranosylaminobenzene 5'-phosphate synthase